MCGRPGTELPAPRPSPRSPGPLSFSSSYTGCYFRPQMGLTFRAETQMLKCDCCLLTAQVALASP